MNEITGGDHMATLWVFTKHTYQEIQLNKGPKQQITIGPSKEHTVTIPSISNTFFVKFHDGQYWLRNNEDQVETKLEHNKEYSIDEHGEKVRIYFSSCLKRKTYYVGHLDEITFSTLDQNTSFYRENDLKTSFSFIKQSNSFHLSNPKGELFKNGQKIEIPSLLETGDMIMWSSMKVTLLEEDFIRIESSETYQTSLPEAIIPLSEMKKISGLSQNTSYGV